jgi:hypothetical protein
MNISGTSACYRESAAAPVLLHGIGGLNAQSELLYGDILDD